MLTSSEARELLGFGVNKFERLVRTGVVPSWTDPDTGRRHFSRAVLERWASEAVTPIKEAS